MRLLLKARPLVSAEQLLYERRMLVTSIAEVTGVARSVQEKGLDNQPYLLEALRLAKRLRQVQQEIEEHDLD